MAEPSRRRPIAKILIGLAIVIVGLAFFWPRAATSPPVTEPPALDAGSTVPVVAVPAPPVKQPPVVPIPAQVVPADGPATFEGRVISLTTALGVPNAEVIFEYGGAAFTARTDPAGAFRFVAEKEGTWTLAMVSAAGFHPFAPEWGHSPISLTARKGTKVSGLSFTLVPALEYAGQVILPDGRSVAGAEVVRVGAGTGESALVAGPGRWTTDEKGQFTFTARDGDWLTATHPKHGRGNAELDFEAQVKGALTIILDEEVAKPRGAITGKVVDGANQPVPGALVFLAEGRSWSFQPDDAEARVRPDAQGPVERAFETRADGTFRFDAVDAERYVVSARAPGLTPAARWASPGDDVLLKLGKGGRITGTVRDSKGQPVPAFTVVVREKRSAIGRETFSTEAFVSPEGRFELEGIPDGVYAILAGAVGYAPSDEVDATLRGGGEARVELKLSQGGTATGRVLKREDQSPLAQARVAVEGNWGEGASAVPLVAEARTASDGTFKLGGLAPGLRSLLVTAAGRNGRILSGLQVKEGETLGPLEVDLAALDGGSPQLELVGIGAVLAADTRRMRTLGRLDSGVILVEPEDSLVMREVLPGGGAAEAGISPGSQILEIDGKKVSELGFSGSIEAIRGQEGTTVRLLIRDRELGGRTVDVKRKKIVK